jgi:hypothetical protein
MSPVLAKRDVLLWRINSVGIGGIVLQKSFCTGDQNFSGL